MKKSKEQSIDNRDGESDTSNSTSSKTNNEPKLRFAASALRKYLENTDPDQPHPDNGLKLRFAASALRKYLENTDPSKNIPPKKNKHSSKLFKQTQSPTETHLDPTEKKNSYKKTF